MGIASAADASSGPNLWSQRYEFSAPQSATVAGTYGDNTVDVANQGIEHLASLALGNSIGTGVWAPGGTEYDPPKYRLVSAGISGIPMDFTPVPSIPPTGVFPHQYPDSTPGNWTFNLQAHFEYDIIYRH